MSSPLAHQSDQMTVRYSAGNEHSADSPLGRTELHLAPDGAAELELTCCGRRTIWTAVADATALQRIRAALRSSSFPSTPQDPWPAGSAGRQIHVSAPGHEDAYAVVEWHTGARLRGYREAFALLDAIVDQMRDPAGPGAESGRVVADVQTVFDGASDR